jgi:hypothetical protein
VKNGTERAGTCKVQLSLRPRFIARFNQLVSVTSQPWDALKQKSEAEGQTVEGEEDHAETGDAANEEEYEEYEGDEHEDVHEYDEDTAEQVEGVKRADVEAVDDGGGVVETAAEGLTAEEDDELYEENDETDGAVLEPLEIFLDEEDLGDDVVDQVENVEIFEEQDPDEYEAEEDEYHDEQGEYNDVQDDEEIHGEENEDEGQGETDHEFVPTTETSEQPVASTQHGIASAYFQSLSNSDTDGNDVDDDLISYEEAVDQTEDGQDYRQQYIEETSTSQTQIGQTNGGPITGGSHDTSVNTVISHGDSGEGSNAPSPTSKRPLSEVSDPSIEDQAPRKYLCISPNI